jgi:hypothetical protein
MGVLAGSLLVHLGAVAVGVLFVVLSLAAYVYVN